MASVLDLAKVLQFVKDRFDQGTTMQNSFFKLGAGHRFHILLERGNELKVLPGQCLSEPVSEVALIGEQLAEQPLAEVGHGLTVIDIASSEPEANQFALRVDDNMELESIEPTHRSLAAPGAVCENPMASNAPVIANSERSSVGDGNPVALAFEHLEQGRQGNHTAGQEFYASLVARQLRKLSLQVTARVNQVKTLELTKAQLMEQNGQGH